MNLISLSVLRAMLATDSELTAPERSAFRRLIDGNPEEQIERHPRLVPQARAAEMLAVSRATIWRMVKKKLLHPVEIMPGQFRYSCVELERLAADGWRATLRPSE